MNENKPDQGKIQEDTTTLDAKVANFKNLSAPEQDELAKKVSDDIAYRSNKQLLKTTAWSMISLSILFAIIDGIFILNVGSPYENIGLSTMTIAIVNALAHLGVMISGIGLLLRSYKARTFGIAAMIINLAIIVPSFVQAAFATLVYVIFAFMNPPGAFIALCVLVRIAAYPYLIHQLSLPKVRGLLTTK